eukprot:TRINITY_DN10669_c0_g1_i1.p1 TRINITY_DN10669_c0_g1~~TRINITY_DN10669_c0_g1_i1.p1  ORF type:complete len:838 (+),score=332.36 TRINITY_DN10669_c0_g1_i1:104-2617(+)
MSGFLAFDMDHVCGADCQDLKLLRAAARKRTLHLARAQFLKRTEEKGVKQISKKAAVARGFKAAPKRSVHPQGALRTAVRARLASRTVETAADLPSLCHGERGLKTSRPTKTSSVSPLLKSSLLVQTSQTTRQTASAPATQLMASAADMRTLSPPAPVPEAALIAERKVVVKPSPAPQVEFVDMEAEMIQPFDREATKVLRAARRAKAVELKRQEYLRNKGQRQQNKMLWKAGNSPADKHARPHGALRTAIRTRLSQSAVEGATDLPVLCHGQRSPKTTRNNKPKTAAVAPMIRQPALSPFASPHLVAAVETGVQELMLADDDLCFDLDMMLPPPAVALGEEVVPCNFHYDACCGQEDKAADIDAVTATPASTYVPSPCTSCAPSPAVVPVEAPEVSPTPCEQKEAAIDEKPTVDSAAEKRQEIMKTLVATLRAQTLEACKAEAEAKEQAQKMAEKLKETQEAGRKSRSKSASAAKKEAIQAERQKAADLKKRRNQQLHLQALEEKAQRALAEAASVKEQAMDEAVLKQCTLEAEAAKTAQQLVQAELQKATQAGEALKRSALEAAELARTEAEEAAAALRKEAAAEVQAFREQELQAAKAKIAAEREAAKEAAEAEAAAVKAKALADAKALKDRAEEQLKAKLSLEVAARKEMQRAKAEAEKEKQHKEAEERKRLAKEAAAQLKAVKAIAQQRSQQYKKQQEQERRRKADEESARQQAEEEALATKAAASAAALALEEKARQTIAEAKVIAQKEAEALREAAKKEAEYIKAKAQQELLELKLALEREQAAACQEEDNDERAGDWQVVADDEECLEVMSFADSSDESADEDDWDVIA